MTRIIAGLHGGRRLVAPAGTLTRPTADRVREALFNALGTMTSLAGARFADLYAGSGAVALEALSRGAAHALLVESDAKASRSIRENIIGLRVGDAAQLITGKVAAVLALGPQGGPFDVVFADPPYDLADEQVSELQQALLRDGWLAPQAIVVVERSTRTAVRGAPLHWVAGLTAERSRRYGETTLWYGRRS